MAKILSIIAPEGYQDKEYGDSKAALEKAGHIVVTSCSQPEAQGKLGGTAKVNVLLKDANPADYDAVMFIGGPGCQVYFEDETAHKIARAFNDADKIVAAICAAPVILGKADMLENKKVTCHPSSKEEIRACGAEYTGRGIERDRNIITADGPESAYDFGEKINEALKEGK